MIIDIATILDMVEQLEVDDLRKVFMWIPTTEMMADFLTKITDRAKFFACRNYVMHA